MGTYHLAGPESASWYQVLLRCKEIGGFSGPVVGQGADELGLPAPRPVASALTSVFVENLSVPAFPPLDDALARMVSR